MRMLGLSYKIPVDRAPQDSVNWPTVEVRVFVMWRMEDERAVPQFVTVSYNEAGRLMDGGEQVDTVPMPAEVMAWVGGYVEANYRPEPKRRIKPRSFVQPKDRVETEGQGNVVTGRFGKKAS